MPEYDVVSTKTRHTVFSKRGGDLLTLQQSTIQSAHHLARIIDEPYEIHTNGQHLMTVYPHGAIHCENPAATLSDFCQ